MTKKKEMVVDEGISYREERWRKSPRRTPAICSVADEHTHVQSTQTPPAPHVRTREAKHTTFFFSFLSRTISFQLGSKIFAFGAIFACVTNCCAISPFVSIFFRASWGNHHVAPIVIGGDPKYSRAFTSLELTYLHLRAPLD
jgi:hypothetical protein